ncbi:MAG: RNA polymerase sigma-70 factor, partial [Paludibacteraceae bacterium]
MNSKHEEDTLRKQFDLLYREYSGRIYNFAMQLSHGDTYLSEEILQTTFMKLWEHRHSIREAEKMRQYMYATAKHTCLNYCEHETVEYMYKHYVEQHSLSEKELGESDSEIVFLESFLKQLVGSMPPVRRRVFIMSRFRHMRNKEIAESLGISEKTVEVHITL